MGRAEIMNRWHRFWWAWGRARESGCGIIEAYRHALWFAGSRGRITRQQRRAFERRLMG